MQTMKTVIRTGQLPRLILVFTGRTGHFVGFWAHYFFLSFYRVNTPRKQGGLGNMNIPLLADTTHDISKKYGVLKEDEGIAFR